MSVGSPEHFTFLRYKVLSAHKRFGRKFCEKRTIKADLLGDVLGLDALLLVGDEDLTSLELLPVVVGHPALDLGLVGQPQELPQLLLVDGLVRAVYHVADDCVMEREQEGESNALSFDFNN